MAHLIVAYYILKVSIATGQDHISVLATIPPDRFDHVMFAINKGINQVSSYHRVGDNDSESSKGEAPGLSGVYKLLHDEELWHAVQPSLEGLY